MLPFLISAVLVAAPPPHIVSPELRAESWVKDVISLAKSKGIDAAVAEVANPKGRFRTDKPERDPVLTVYTVGLKVLAQNRPTHHIGMDHVKVQNSAGEPYLVKMLIFAKKSGPDWFEYMDHDSAHQERVFRAYVAIHGDHFIVAAIAK